MKSTYNGWRNYETWLTNLWLNNDQGSYEHWREQARAAWRHAEATDLLGRADVARADLVERLKGEIEACCPCLESGLHRDLLDAALSEIDWYEVADAFLEGVADESGAQDEAR